MDNQIKKSMIVFLSVMMLLIGCSQRNGSPVEENNQKPEDISTQESIEVVYDDEDIAKEFYKPINFDVLAEKNIDILEENICKKPRSVFEDPWLYEQFAGEIEESERFVTEYGGTPTEIVFFLFDFNGDGIDEYLLCFSGSLYNGTKGQSVEIYQRTEDNQRKRIFSVVTRLKNPYGTNGDDGIPDKYSSGYWPIVVLNEKTNGYYDIILPFVNTLWKYSAETEEYEFAGRIGEQVPYMRLDNTTGNDYGEKGKE